MGISVSDEEVRIVIKELNKLADEYEKKAKETRTRAKILEDQINRAIKN